MEQNKPIVSILCATRNDARFIKETLKTVESQTYPWVELVIMDGASTDGTAEIIEKYASRHANTIWRSEPDHGQWEALEKALALAKGEYISLLCGQDGYLDNDWFMRCMQTFEAHPEVSLVWGIPFNMSEDGKLLGPHYAYAGFLKDERYGSQTRPLSTVTAKIDWKRPDALKRLWQMVRKLTPSRAIMVWKSFRKQDLPQKQDWFSYWLETARAFPEGNMVVRKNVFIKNTTRYPDEKMTNAALMDFCFNFNANGYLAYGLPIAASFGRSHAEGQALRDYDKVLTAKYRGRVAQMKASLAHRESFVFIDPNGKTVSERNMFK